MSISLFLSFRTRCGIHHPSRLTNQISRGKNRDPTRRLLIVAWASSPCGPILGSVCCAYQKCHPESRPVQTKGPALGIRCSPHPWAPPFFITPVPQSDVTVVYSRASRIPAHTFSQTSHLSAPCCIPCIFLKCPQRVPGLLLTAC